MPAPFPVSQGASFTGLPEGLTNVKVKKTAADPTSTSNKIDASTLDLAAGSDRVYQDAPLVDAGAGATEGVTTTITASFFGDDPPVAGNAYTIMGFSVKCTETEIEYAVGDLVKATVTYVGVPED
jgi:hypothetical protein